MALVVKESIVCGTILGVWRKEEDLEILETVYPLSEQEIEELETYSNQLKKIEYLTTRVLITEILEGKYSIAHRETGKPYIPDSELHLSISHSQNFVAVLVSKNKEVGIDVEHISERARKVRRKFLNKKELDWIADDETMTIAWSAKEAVFKIYEKELDFQDIHIDKQDFEDDRGTFVAHVRRANEETDFFLTYWKLDDNVLVYTAKDCVK